MSKQTKVAQMNDRELLELAAKAAGIQLSLSGYRIDTLTNEQWNPLTDDGDALRLALACGLEVREREARWWPSEHASRVLIRDEDADPYAATRRAITRAAAEIGKGRVQHVNADLPEDNYYKTMAEAEQQATIDSRIAELEAKNAQLLEALQLARPWFGSGVQSEHRSTSRSFWSYPMTLADRLVDKAIKENTK